MQSLRGEGRASALGNGQTQLDQGLHVVPRAHLRPRARKLSWKDTALSFGTTWDQVCHSVEYVVRWGLEHRELGTLRAIGVDEIHIGKSHKFLTLVY